MRQEAYLRRSRSRENSSVSVKKSGSGSKQKEKEPDRIKPARSTRILTGLDGNLIELIRDRVAAKMICVEIIHGIALYGLQERRSEPFVPHTRSGIVSADVNGPGAVYVRKNDAVSLELRYLCI